MPIRVADGGARGKRGTLESHPLPALDSGQDNSEMVRKFITVAFQNSPKKQHFRTAGRAEAGC